jgi:hypothetical protein
VARTLRRLKSIIRVLKRLTNVKCCYLFLALFYPDSVKHISNVKLSIELGYIKLKERFLKKREKITVLNYNYI